MKRILLMLMVAGLTQYSVLACPKKDCTCKTSATTTHKTAMHKMHATNKKVVKKINTGTALMVANKANYVPYTNYAVFTGRVHMSNRVVCTTQKELVPDPLSGGMVPVVSPVNTTTCEDKMVVTPAPLVTPVVYKGGVTNLNSNKNSNVQPCAYKNHNIRVSYCVQ